MKEHKYNIEEMVKQFEIDTKTAFAKLCDAWSNDDAWLFCQNVTDTVGIILELGRISITKKDFKLFEKQISEIANKHIELVQNIAYESDACDNYGDPHYNVKGVW